MPGRHLTDAIVVQVARVRPKFVVPPRALKPKYTASGLHMGAGASAGVADKVTSANDAEIAAALAELPENVRARLSTGLRDAAGGRAKIKPFE